MINTISDLLRAFVEAENAALNKYEIKHRPTIGEMYEGLTQELVNRSIFGGMNLVVSTQSFIEGSDTEFDVILAEGEGEMIPYTTSRKYKPSQVIAVFQVKKTLSARELRNSYDNLKQVAIVFQKDFSAIDPSIVDDSLKKICHKELSAYSSGKMNLQEEYIYHSLVMDSYMPLRFVFGYNGYKTEEGFRQSFIDFLDSNKSSETERYEGFSPKFFPNMIISDGFSLAKLTGCPYSLPLGIIKDGWWEVMASSNYNPMHIFLEMLWTKFAYRFGGLPSSLFGDDLESEPFSPLLRAKIHSNSDGNAIGWDYEYSYIEEETLSANSTPIEWSPAVIDDAQSVVLSQLGRNSIDIDQDKDLVSYVTSEGYPSLQEFIQSLVRLGFVSFDGTMLKLITRQLNIVISPDGKTYAADDYDGRFTRWMQKRLLN